MESRHSFGCFEGLKSEQGERAEGSGRGIMLYPIARNWEIEVLESNGGWSYRRSRVTLPAPPVLTGYGYLKKSEYQLQARYSRELRWPSEPAERAFLNFDGLLHGATIILDGTVIGTAKGGYGTERIEVTDRVPWGRRSRLVVEIDSRERADIPPFGKPATDDCPGIDFHAFSGISRPPTVELTPAVYVSNARALVASEMDRIEKLEVTCFLDWAPTDWVHYGADSANVKVALIQEGRILAEDNVGVEGRAQESTLTLEIPAGAKPWLPEAPALADLVVTVRADGAGPQLWQTRVGLRTVQCREDGVYINGRHYKIRGVNRHELYPYLGPCVPRRLQRLDARTIKDSLACNLVRTAHYPQAPAFLEACDELGLMVFEETPGWGYLGTREWREVVCRDVASMVRRDWNHPSIVMWGIRCNEAPHDDDLYSVTNAIAHKLDPSRPTGGARLMADYEVPIIEDVSCVNDYSEVPLAPNHQPYLITEFVGAITPTYEDGHVYHRTQSLAELSEQGMRHARFYDGVCGGRGNHAFVGAIGWSAFDYQSSCGLKRRWRDVKTPGVCDLFRIPKLAAGFYGSQRPAAEGIVVEANFLWDEEVVLPIGEVSDGIGALWVWTNAEVVRAVVDGSLVAEGIPDRKAFPNLPYPPVRLAVPASIRARGTLVLEAFIDNALVKERSYDAARQADRVYLAVDDRGIIGEGGDATRAVVGIADRFGNPRYRHSGVLELEVEGPGVIIGPKEIRLSEIGGIAAVFVTATPGSVGKVTVVARCAGVGSATAEVEVMPAPSEEL